MEEVEETHVPGRGQGRPPATSHAAIERAAFRLFARRGFQATSMADIATEVGIGRRTLFRYYAVKNDIPWGQFDDTLVGFRRLLAEMPEELPLWESVHRAVIAFNDFPPAADPDHRTRMRLILSTPELQAHSVLRYRQWRQVISDYVSQRTGADPGAVLPHLVGQVSLALALTAYERWIDDETADLAALLGETLLELRRYLAGP